MCCGNREEYIKQILTAVYLTLIVIDHRFVEKRFPCFQ